MKLVFTLSDGEAAVERDFSINKDTFQTNMGEKTLIARRFIYNSVDVYYKVYHYIANN